ncbi:MAG TPA: hypothetical protein VFX48_05010, partial [Saprospiraceae bacterium]|nr:hypothetical protein [Saprospiraceae bacterium]
ADCVCDPSYLRSVQDYFHQHPDRQAVSIGFRHLLQHLDDAHVRAIQLYELHLRAYIGWQKFYRYPFAFQTLGSCFAVRSRAYQLQGGMNRRKAGEDFYFLHKFSLIGQLGELPQVLVFPSGRSSTRVPFGTGKAVAGLLYSEGICKSYHPQAIAAFCNFMKSIQDNFSSFRQGGTWRDHCTLASIQAYMNELDLDAKIAEALAHAGSGQAFSKRISKCFDPFRLMKYLHWARELEFPDIDVRESALELIAAATNGERPASDGPEELLQRLIALGY